MVEQVDGSQGAGRGGEPVMKNTHDMQIDKETGLPVAIAPDGEKEPTRDKVDPKGAARIDPESRIPRPVQPDLA